MLQRERADWTMSSVNAIIFNAAIVSVSSQRTTSGYLRTRNQRWHVSDRPTPIVCHVSGSVIEPSFETARSKLKIDN